MTIHDDYYDQNYGIDFINIDTMYVGLLSDADRGSRQSLVAVPLEGWGNDVTFHERLKPSYYLLRSVWSEEH